MKARALDGRVFRARAAILTLPVRVWETVAFSPPLPEKLRALALVEMGAVVKVGLRFREAFWKKDKRAKAKLKSGGDFNFFHAHDLPFPTWWTSAPLEAPAVDRLGGRARSPSARGTGRSGAPPALALSSLSRLFGVPAPRVAADPRSDRFPRLASRPAGPAGRTATWPPEARTPRGLWAKPEENTLFFAGEATDAEGLGGTVESALTSGERAAREVLAALPRAPI